MTLYQFNLLDSETEKYDIIFTKGKFIHALYEKDKRFALSAIKRFFVEVEYDPKSNKIVSY